jgi:hypothetical protein
MVLCESLIDGPREGLREALAGQRVYAKCTQPCFFVYERKRLHARTLLQSKAAHPKQADVRKHFGAVQRSAVPDLGVTCAPFFRWEAPPLLQLPILTCQRVPQTPHFGGLPAPAKQTLNRLPIVMTKCEGDLVVPRAKLDADLFRFVEPRGGEEIATFPEHQLLAQIQPFQYRPKLRDPRVLVKWILQSKSSRKLQLDGKFRLRPAMKFETVFTFLKRWQRATISQPKRLLQRESPDRSVISVRGICGAGIVNECQCQVIYLCPSMYNHVALMLGVHPEPPSLHSGVLTVLPRRELSALIGTGREILP